MNRRQFMLVSSLVPAMSLLPSLATSAPEQAALASDFVEMDGWIVESQDKVAILEKQRNDALQQRDQAIAERDEAIKQRDEAIKKRQEIEGSEMWKATRPLRSLIEFF